MKRLLSVLLVVLTLVTALVGEHVGLINEGVMNIGLFVGWCYALVFLFAFLVCISNDGLIKEMAKKFSAKPKRPKWMTRIEVFSLYAISPALVFFSYWSTAILWTALLCAAHLLAYLIVNELKKLEETSAKEEQTV
ncbi:hypothetical protein [Grimontia sp. NTOU-MAR1]|uniref:hypothetical protein n=1 Tax=Grimontia sp. NTOU-MAR1 TaxID=3111011 RepID=UPI002DB68FA6|nr:hypothetical protein [Grimontia sp. NTOU-MAR1]WRV96513.1 hypothetical protein VP504_10375 [Grimontia sp. NTOU-MAR1]